MADKYEVQELRKLAYGVFGVGVHVFDGTVFMKQWLPTKKVTIKTMEKAISDMLNKKAD